ncbi:MAG TPA: hypothetical protein VIR01_19250, partial [Pyrinomonadaceae bacterium]
TVPDFHRFLLAASRRRFEKDCYRLNQCDFRPKLFACDKVGPASIFRCQAIMISRVDEPGGKASSYKSRCELQEDRKDQTPK